MGNTHQTCGYLLLVFCCCTLLWRGSTALVVHAPNGTELEVEVPLTRDPDHAQKVETFEVNETGPHHFRTVLRDDDSLIVGARNAVFNISLIDLRENKRITWTSSPEDEVACKMQQRTVEECQNYIRVLVHKSNKELLVCGTNAYNPSCRTYRNDMETFITGKDTESGVGKVPYSSFHNNTALHVGGRLFAATVADPQGRDPIIYSESAELPMRTELHDSTWLNEPNFVSSFEYSDKVYFLYRETALEHINCGKAVFSRVARVCKNDKGGARVLRNTWTSYFKARLNCSIPGEFPFYFDEVQGTTELGEGNYRPSLLESSRTKMFYAVFNTPQNGIPGSAVCAFTVGDILKSFEGPFKEQKTAQSSWLPVKDIETPTPHPARTCANDSSTLSDQTLNFIRGHPLMDQAVPAFGGSPIITQASFDYRMTTIAVDWQIKASDDRYYDVLFIGTADGRVVKAINKGHGAKIETVTIEHVQVFTDKAPIISLQIYRKGSTEKLVVIGQDQIKSIPLARCQIRITCGGCVGLQDPYCSWNKDKDHCEHSRTGIQSVDTGRHTLCNSEGETPNNGVSGRHFLGSEGSRDPNAVGENGIPAYPGPCLSESKASSSCSGAYKAGDMALAAVLCFIIALLLGLIIGFLVSRRFHLRIWQGEYVVGCAMSRQSVEPSSQRSGLLA